MKFILTRELGRLAKWLRILGFDTAYFNQDNIGALIIQALREDRIIITRNQRLANTARGKLLLLKSENFKEQIFEVLKGLQLNSSSDMMFSRCTICNTQLSQISKGQVEGKVPEYVFRTQEVFFSCPGCQRVYWAGTHWGNVENILKETGVAI